jgi:hypothetical protein
LQDVDAAKSTQTTTPQTVDGTEDKNAPDDSPQDLSANNSAMTIEHSGDRTNVNKSANEISAGTMERVQVNNNDLNDAEMSNVENSAGTMERVQINLNNDDIKDAEMSAAAPPLTAAMKETDVPVWLRRMLIYFRGVSDSVEWQDLVSALLKFENLKPPPGVGVLLQLICLF